MLKNSKILIYSLILLLSKTIFASNSASFLIAQTAFNDYDFRQVLYEYSAKEKIEYKSDYLDELISAVITENINLAEKISKQILLTDPYNQEAKLLMMVKFANAKNEKELETLRFDKDNQKNDLFEFIFFLSEKIKSNKDISNSFLEIVRSSYTKQSTNYSQNYNFLLFYTSLAILVNEKNYEAILIKGQLLQMIDDYFFAEATYQKIPEESDYFINAQRNIAFNYSQENGFDDVEDKIKVIVKNNNKDYEITKILADFYRVEKKFDLAIKIYSELIEEKPNDLWYTYYLRGI